MFLTAQNYIREFYGIRFFTPKINHAAGEYNIIEYDDSGRKTPPCIQAVKKAMEEEYGGSGPPRSAESEAKHKNKRTRFTSAPSGQSPKQKERVRKTTRTDDRQSGANRSQKRKRGNEFRVTANKRRKSATGPRSTKNWPHSFPSDDDEPEYPQPRSRHRKTLLPRRLKYAPEWFRLVQRMVLKENMDDYELNYYSPSQCILFMVIRGWIELSEVIAWRHARVELGGALVDNMNRQGGFKWISTNGAPDAPLPLTEDEATLFRDAWQVCTNPEKRYNWKEDSRERRRHGPFGERAAKYVTPGVQEEVLHELLKPDVDIEKVDLPGNWRPLFEPLFRKKRTSSPQPRPASEFEFQRKAEKDGGLKGPLNSHKDGGNNDLKRKYHIDKDHEGGGDNDDDDDNDGSRWKKKGKWRADAPGVSGQACNPTPTPTENVKVNHEPIASSEIRSSWDSRQASNPTSAPDWNMEGNHESAPSVENPFDRESVTGHPGASVGATADIQQPTVSPIQQEQEQNQNQAVTNQFGFPGTGFKANQPVDADADMEDVATNSLQAPTTMSEQGMDCEHDDAEMHVETAEPIQWSQASQPMDASVPMASTSANPDGGSYFPSLPQPQPQPSSSPGKLFVIGAPPPEDPRQSNSWRRPRGSGRGRGAAGAGRGRGTGAGAGTRRR